MATDAEIVKALRRWGKPTVEACRVHVAACESLELEPTPFFVFAADVFGTPEEKRDWLLSNEPAEAAGPRVHYAQYTAPRQEDMPTGLFYRDYRKGKK